MPSDNYISVSLPKNVVERLKKLRTEIEARGYNSIPAAIRGNTKEGVTFGLVVESALSALEAELPVKDRRG